MLSNPARDASPLSLNLSRRTRGRRATLRSPPRSAVPPTDLEEIQLAFIATGSKSSQSDSHDKHSSQETKQQQQDTPDEPQTLSLNTRSSSPLSVYHDLLKALTYSSLVLENSGNLARDHLSTERTWLAYIRTSLLLASTGVGIVQFFALTVADNPTVEDEATKIFDLSTTLQRFARPLGESTVILALFIMLIGLHRYFKLQNAILQGVFPAARILVVLLSASLAIFVVVICGIFLTLS